MNPFIPTDCPFEILGYIEEFDDAETFKSLGFRRVPEPDRPTGSPGRKEYVLTEPLNLLKGYRQIPVAIKSGRRVIASIQIICGKEKRNE